MEYPSKLIEDAVNEVAKLPGIGKKTAERMVLELRDKLDAFGAAPSAAKATPVEEDVLSALVNLGYQRPAAEKAVGKAAEDGKKTFEQLFREAMALLRK